MKKFLGIVIISILLAASGCSKDTEQHRTIDADLVTNFDYKVGTYWIYRDSISGQVDSFYVYQNNGAGSIDDNGTLVDGIGIYFNQEKISGPGVADTIKWVFDLESNYIALGLTLTRFGQIADQMSFPVFISYPFSLGHPSGNYEGMSGGNVTEILSKYLLNGNSYDSVAVLNYNGNVNGYPINDTYYINAKVGIIKMSLNHTNGSLRRVWELQYSNVIR